MEGHAVFQIFLISLLGSICLQNGYAYSEMENSTAVGTNEDGSSDVPKQPMGPDVFRQLLNQETLIRMALVKNVNSLMLDMVSLKNSVMSLQKNVEQITKVSVEDIMGLKLENKKLKNSNELLTEINWKQNQTISKLVDDVTDLKNEQKLYAKEMIDRDDYLFGNTSAALSELKTNFRVLSLSLVNVDNQSQDFKKRLNEVDKSLPQTINEKFSIVSEAMKNASNQLSDIQKRIGFTAGKNSSSSGWSSGKLVFEHVLFNQGNGYDPSSGVFTAPTNGVYVFYVSLTSYDTNTIYVSITLNGKSTVSAWGRGESGGSYRNNYYTRYQTGTNMAVLSLMRGDRVWVQYGSGTGYYSDSVPVTTFSGFII
ncbi:hypothetical protein FSP39_018595 [Pinctada imbricata]|uniref:C1q domain-containing protein n=1 Tax=Pinctada imbricata TaxID=66713 RepID=A0AA88YV79_PINIB|nr:hypothetical protein FSP39_018595 [Pinctada imbricata]